MTTLEPEIDEALICVCGFPAAPHVHDGLTSDVILLDVNDGSWPE